MENNSVKNKVQKTNHDFIVALAVTKGEKLFLRDANLYVSYSKEIRPSNFILDTFFKPHFIIIVSPRNPVLNEGNYEIPRGSKYCVAKIAKYQDRIIKKYNNDVVVDSILFNWEISFELESPKEETMVWITLKIGADIIGPPQAFHFVKSSEKVDLSEIGHYHDYDTDYPSTSIAFNPEDISNQSCQKIASQINNFKKRQNQLGMNIIHYMSCFKNKECIDLMNTIVPTCKELIDVRDCSGNTPLHYAQISGNDEAVAILIKNGANQYIKNNDNLSFSDNQIAKDPFEKFKDLGKLKNLDLNIEDVNKIVNVLTSQNEMLDCYLNINSEELWKFEEYIKKPNNFYKESNSQYKSLEIRKNTKHPEVSKTQPIYLKFPYEPISEDILPEKLSLRLLLIEKHTPTTIQDESFSDTLSPFATFINQRKTKIYHFALCVGPWMLEWNETSFVVPKRCVFNAAFYANETGFNMGKLDSEFAIKQAAKTVSQWNKTKVYNHETCNSRHFVDTLFSALTSRIITGNNFEQFKATGYKETPEVVIPDNIASMILKNDTENIKKRLVVGTNGLVFRFQTHEQLDHFLKVLTDIGITSDMLHKNPEFYFILKSYDRIFWLNHFDHSSLSNVCYRPHKENETEYSPLKDEERVLDECHFGDFNMVFSSDNYDKWWI